jgi:glycosyltransferase involved in cell wall biosynthesis
VVSRRVAFPVQRNPLSRWKYQRATHYIAVSRFVEQMLLDGGVASSRISVVYDGVPVQPPSDGPDIVVPQTADPRKGMALALAGVKLAGLTALTSRNLEQDLTHAALFLYITHSEGLGSAVLVAMAAGVPVIASNVGGLPEIVDHGCTGLLTENSPQAISAAVRRLMEDRAFAQSLATQARCLVQQKFSVERMVTDTLAVYEALA